MAGNPFGLLRISSDLPGGLVSVFLFDFGPDFRCDGGSEDGGSARLLTLGTVDLRFHAGNFQGADFATGTPVPVRVDLPSVAEVLPAGHRLGLVVAGPDPIDRGGQPLTPTITVHADGGDKASHITVPVAAGTMGGQSPTLSYPPRPFLPRSRG